MPSFMFTLSEQQTQQVLNALAERPLKETLTVFVTIQEQIAVQQKKPEKELETPK